MKGDLLSIFSITNGRSTHAYSLQSLVEGVAGKPIPLHIIRDLPWVEALNTCLRQCETPYFLRVDDDFVFHSKALGYAEGALRNIHKGKTGLGCLYFMLYENHSSRVRKGVKIYGVEALNAIGGFQGDPITGRVDRVMGPKLAEAGFRVIADSSVLHLHICGTQEEQERYNRLWGNRTKQYYCNSSVEEQAFLRGRFVESLNRVRKTPFYTYLVEKGFYGFGKPPILLA